MEKKGKSQEAIYNEGRGRKGGRVIDGDGGGGEGGIGKKRRE